MGLELSNFELKHFTEGMIYEIQSLIRNKPFYKPKLVTIEAPKCLLTDYNFSARAYGFCTMFEIKNIANSIKCKT